MFSNQPKTLLYLQNGKAQISISSVSQTKELITNTGNRDHVFLATPLGLFSNLPGPLPITSCVRTYETCEVELWWLLLLADIFRGQNVNSSVYVAVSLSHDEKIKKRHGPALKFSPTKIQSKNQLNQYCLLLQPPPTPPCVKIVLLSPLPG